MNKVEKDTDWRLLVIEVLRNRCISQNELAEICGTAQQTVSNWVTGIRIPNYRSKRKILELSALSTTANPEKYKVPHYNIIKEERTEYAKYANYDDFVTQISNIGVKLTCNDRIEVIKYATFRLKSR